LAVTVFISFISCKKKEVIVLGVNGSLIIPTLNFSVFLFLFLFWILDEKLEDLKAEKKKIVSNP